MLNQDNYTIMFKQVLLSGRFGLFGPVKKLYLLDLGRVKGLQ
jgi:hypothetical protein